MDAIHQDEIRVSREASGESGITSEGEAKFYKSLVFEWEVSKNKEGKSVYANQTTVCKTFKQLLGSSIQHMGRVTLVSLTIKYQTSAADQTVAAVVTNANAEVAMGDIIGRPGGFKHTSNSMNYGSTTEVKLIVPDLFTRQIQPDSANAPMPKLVLSYSPLVAGSLIIGYNCDGPVMEYSKLRPE